MADLIININIDESRRKEALILETYEGKIPHLKSKQYSGPLRNVNLSLVTQAENLNAIELQNLKRVFNDKRNTQISKHQYLFSVDCLPYLYDLINYGCFFCKENQKSPMYEIEKLCLNSEHSGMIRIDNFFILQEKTILYINYSVDTRGGSKKEIVPLMYIDVSTPEYKAKLYFDYGNTLVGFDEKERHINKAEGYRDYKVETKIVGLIRECNWINHEKGMLVYKGNNVCRDLQILATKGIHLYTNEKKKINVVGIPTVSVCSGIDWFEISGKVKVGNQELDISNLVDFSQKKTDWTEFDGQVLFIPSDLKEHCRNGLKQDGTGIRIEKKDILNSLEVIDYFGGFIHKDTIPFVQNTDIQLDLPNCIASLLRDYQKEGVRWLLSLQKNGFGGCLADDMGLGKTLQIIAFLSDKSQCESQALIIVPKTLLENWKREFQKFNPQMSLYLYHGSGRNLSEAKKHRVIITTYGTLLNDIEILNQLKYGHLIVDEAQNIKNSRSKTYKAVRIIQADTKIILTGTPLENNLQEYWDLMRLVNPTQLSFKTMAARLEEDQLVEKVKKITRPFILRRIKKDVLRDLPEKEEITVYCNFDGAQKQLYENVLESIKYEISRIPGRYEIKSNSMILNGLLYLQEICCHPRLLPIEYNTNKCVESAKTEVLMSMLAELYSSEHKIVVFSRFTRMLDIINKEVIKKNYRVYYLDGKTTDRQKVVDSFENSKEGIFLISLKAGGVGLNLVSADTAVIYDPWWNPSTENQAEDRLHRIGQKNKVTIYKLIMANTIEEKVQELQRKKMKLFNDTMDGNGIPHNITMEGIKELIDG